MAALLALLPAAGHDQLWFLLMAQRWLHGAPLYGPEIFDSNTPAIVWLSALPVTLARLLHLPIPVAAKLCVVLLLTTVAALSHGILRRLVPALTRAQTLFLLFAFILLAGVVPARDFGQRDQLTAFLCLPYLLAAALAPSSQKITSPGRQLPLRLATGILAGLAICLKPQQALVPLAVEAALLLRSPASTGRRRFTSLLGRPEPAVLLLCGVLFLVLLHTLTPLFFTLTLPTLFATYWAIGHLTSPQLFAAALELHLLAALTLVLVLRSLRRPPGTSFAEQLRAPVTILVIAGIAATAAFYVQGTGWYYQQLPGLTFFAAALTLHLLPTLPQLQLPRWTPSATAALVVLALALTTHFTGYPFTPDRAYSVTSPNPSFFRALPPGTPIATLTTSVDDAIMPVFRYGLTWSQRTNNLWTLPAILRSADPARSGWPVPPRHHIPPAQLASLANRQRRWMVEDLTRWQPRLVLVARCQDPAVHCQELEDRHDDLLAFFFADPAFASLWQHHYSFQRRSGDYDAYTLTSPIAANSAESPAPLPEPRPPTARP